MSQPVKFELHDMTEFNPFAELDTHKRIFLKADDKGLYTIHMHHGKGVVFSSVESFTLFEAMSRAMDYRLELGYPDNSLAFDLPKHVLELPDVFSARLKKNLLKSGIYFELYGQPLKKEMGGGCL
ncbi:hypothetical protein ABE237_22515 [Brevibacillus formosus]|uniref:hypothetical protein n=1 Tax=Brevibacillus formosus TaxID=54913 RepID=UPI003D241340|nr:hypothetical protein [Brevibacillus formosus]